MATEGQKNLIRTVMSERDLEEHHVQWVEERLDRADNALVQTILSRLKALPRKGARQMAASAGLLPTEAYLAVDVTPRERVSEVGFYKADDGGVFKVVKSQIGRLYAKETTARGLAYREGAMALLFADQKMTGEQIAAHGVTNCYCVNCSTELTDPISKQVGLGTSCGPAILGKDGYKAARKAALEIPAVAAAHKAHQGALKADREALKALRALKAAREAVVELPLEADNAAAELAASFEAPAKSAFEAIYFAMADMGFKDSDIRDARYGAGNW